MLLIGISFGFLVTVEELFSGRKECLSRQAEQAGGASSLRQHSVHNLAILLVQVGKIYSFRTMIRWLAGLCKIVRTKIAFFRDIFGSMLQDSLLTQW